jgi:hypothetical protein
MKSLEYIEDKFVLTSIFYWKPVYADQYGCDMIQLLCPCYESGRAVLCTRWSLSVNFLLVPYNKALL